MPTSRGERFALPCTHKLLVIRHVLALGCGEGLPAGKG